MSYTICYDKRIFKVGEDKYITMILAGDNNVYDISLKGKEIPSKDWSEIRYKGNCILSKKELEIILDDYANDSLAKSRYNYFDKNKKEFQKWVLSGLKNAITVEEAVSYNRRNRFIIQKAGDRESLTCAETTEELLAKIELFESDNERFRLHLDCRDFTPKRRTPKDKAEKKVYEKFFVIQIADHGKFDDGCDMYISAMRKNSIKYGYNAESPVVKKFKIEKEAQRYLKKYEERLLKSDTHMRVVEVNKPVLL